MYLLLVLEYAMAKPTQGRVFDILRQVQGSRRQAQVLDRAHIHPFPARMPTALAEFLIEQCTDPSTCRMS
jgi:hypothetical protein